MRLPPRPLQLRSLVEREDAAQSFGDDAKLGEPPLDIARSQPVDHGRQSDGAKELARVSDLSVDNLPSPLVVLVRPDFLATGYHVSRKRCARGISPAYAARILPSGRDRGLLSDERELRAAPGRGP
jgi:hypothetical protein